MQQSRRLCYLCENPSWDASVSLSHYFCPDICYSDKAGLQSLVAEDSFQHILRVLNTNVDGKQKIVYAMTAIRGLGRRFSNLVCKKAEVDLSKRYVNLIILDFHFWYTSSQRAQRWTSWRFERYLNASHTPWSLLPKGSHSFLSEISGTKQLEINKLKPKHSLGLSFSFIRGFTLAQHLITAAWLVLVQCFQFRCWAVVILYWYICSAGELPSFFLRGFFGTAPHHCSMTGDMLVFEFECWDVIILLWYICRAGELSAAELENIMSIVGQPRTYKIPDWFLNRQRDHKDGKFSQLTASALDTKFREDLERLKKIRYRSCTKLSRSALLALLRQIPSVLSPWDTAIVTLSSTLQAVLPIAVIYDDRILLLMRLWTSQGYTWPSIHLSR